MGKIVSLEGEPLGWAKLQFERYYRSHRVDPPPRFARREFAAFPFTAETMMRRHASFRSAVELSGFLEREAPRHVYYSSAYYEFPDHPRMAEKEWLGADLIFDLDADHLRGAPALDYAGQLALVKRKLIALLDDFLFGDFGIDPGQTSIVFSGGRGYHVHVQEEAYLTLNSPERREIVEYILGTGAEPSRSVLERRETEHSGLSLSDSGPEDGGTGLRGSPRTRSFKRLASPDAPGWTGRTTRAVLQLLDRWDTEGREVAAAELETIGLPRARARSLARLLVDQGRGKQIREGLSLDVFAREVPKEFLEVVLQQAAVEVQGETDAPVTTDIHRLIRLPGSLHGGTGFRVVPLQRDELSAFDPMHDALVPAPPRETVQVVLSEETHHAFRDHPIDGKAGDHLTVPTPQGLFLLLRGEAALRPSPG